jgi:hypothetical protein
MKADDRLQYEARVGTRYAVLAALAGILLVVAAAIQLSGLHVKVDELTADLIVAHKRYPLDIIGAFVNACALLAVAGTLAYLYGAAMARKPELKSWIRIVTIVGGILAALSGVIYAFVIASKANDFVSHGTQTYQEAHQLTQATIVLVMPFIGQAAALLLAIGFVLTSLNALRVGLLTRFMGYLGIFAGVLVIFPIGSPVPVVQGFWLLALAYLLAGRWPTGVPPAWKSGRAEPWPSSAAMREQRTKAAPAGGKAGARTKPARAPAPQPVPATGARGPRAETSKRKRKRRK